jgi:DNA polymerase IV
VGRSADLPRQSGQTDGDDRGCPILHVDMDAFFASVEIRRRPELRGKPVVVGGGVRGVVAAASYEARRFGVRSAMPISRALRLCPQAAVVRPDHSAYRAVSEQVMQILTDVTPLVEPVSVDEAFLDVAGSVRLLGRPTEIARHIRARVAAELELSCSVGVAATKFVAKLASSLCKPDGLKVVPAAETLAFLHPLPVSALWGVGPTTAQALRRRGIGTVGDLASSLPDVLRRAVGASAAAHLAALARGEDPREVEPERVEKSISSERTFDVDIVASADVERQLLRLAEEVGARLRGRQMLTAGIGIKVRYADFRTITRVHALNDWTDRSAEIHRSAVQLYRGLNLDRPRIRLLGIKAEKLSPVDRTPRQATLDLGPLNFVRPADGTRRAAVERVADEATRRFGAEAVRAASLLSPGLSDR